MVSEVTVYMNIVWQKIHFELFQLKSQLIPKVDEIIVSIINNQIDPETYLNGMCGAFVESVQDEDIADEGFTESEQARNQDAFFNFSKLLKCKLDVSVDLLNIRFQKVLDAYMQIVH